MSHKQTEQSVLLSGLSEVVEPEMSMTSKAMSSRQERVTVHGPGLAHFSSRNRTPPTIHDCLLRQRIRKNVPVPLLQAVNGYQERKPCRK